MTVGVVQLLYPVVVFFFFLRKALIYAYYAVAFSNFINASYVWVINAR